MILSKTSEQDKNKPNILALCIPAFNASLYLPKVLTSAQMQQIAFDEILVYDDCSTDNTAEIAASFGAKVIKGDINRGCTWARKVLAEESTSKWIHFHDADDDILPQFSILAYKWIEKQDCPDVVLFNYEWRDYITNEYLGTTYFNKLQIEEDPIKFCINYQVNPFCGLYNRQRFLQAGGPDLDPNVLQNEDVAMHCKLAIARLSFSVESEIAIINYRVPNSMSRTEGSYKKGVNAQFHVMKKNLYATGGLYKAEIGRKLWTFTRHAAWVSDWKLVKDILLLLKEMNHTRPINDSMLFQAFCRVSPYHAIVLREFYARIFRKKNTYWY